MIDFTEVSAVKKNKSAKTISNFINPSENVSVIVNFDENNWVCILNFQEQLNKIFNDHNPHIDSKMSLEELKDLVNYTDSMILSEDSSKIKYIELTEEQENKEYIKYKLIN